MHKETRDEILSILQGDSRTPPEKIATLTGLSVEQVKSAIADYEKRGVIKRYKTVVDWEKVGDERIFAFIDVKVQPARDVGFDAVASRIYRFPEVSSLWLVSGGNDLRVVVHAKNIRDLGRFVAEKLATIEGVMGTTTHFMLKRYKEDDEVFADSHEDERLMISP